MGVHLNVHMSKIMCTLIKVGIHTYAIYANCQTLGEYNSISLHLSKLQQLQYFILFQS